MVPRAQSFRSTQSRFLLKVLVAVKLLKKRRMKLWKQYSLNLRKRDLSHNHPKSSIISRLNKPSPFSWHDRTWINRVPSTSIVLGWCSIKSYYLPRSIWKARWINFIIKFINWNLRKFLIQNILLCTKWSRNVAILYVQNFSRDSFISEQFDHRKMPNIFSSLFLTNKNRKILKCKVKISSSILAAL